MTNKTVEARLYKLDETEEVMDNNKTTHKMFFSNSKNMMEIENNSIDLIITSPPYPMIEMWDEILSRQNSQIIKSLSSNTQDAFELMHQVLDAIWAECYRVLKDGAFICINIGNATRTINGDFALYDNHSRIVQSCLKFGLTELPSIVWRKQTNAPNKFMGSGMLPNGAYVTQEHEHILIFRKGEKRNYYKEDDKKRRRESAFFWEERNVWFSDIWDFKGARQSIKSSCNRERNASFPIELPHRLINMYSQKNDIVLDPFAGLGTTMKAAMLNKRNSIGYDIDKSLFNIILDEVASIDIDEFNSIIHNRIESHEDFVAAKEKEKGELKYFNNALNCSVMTGQEEHLKIEYIDSIKQIEGEGNTLTYAVDYVDNLPKNTLF